MHRIFLFSFLIVLCALGKVPEARADFIVWQDAKTGLVLSFPDTWKVVNNLQPNDLVTVDAPSGDGYASCRVRKDDAMRLANYPARLSSPIQKLQFSTRFWQEYLVRYENPQIEEIRDYAGLGRGVAGFTVASFARPVPGDNQRRRAMIFVTHYYDTIYMLECSAVDHAFDAWRLPFLSVAKSIDFKKTYHELYTGDYRDFLNDNRYINNGYDAQGHILY